MNKRVLAVIMLVVVLVLGLCACNGKVYTNDAISYDADAAVENNGGMIVKKGGYIYFVNAYLGADADNKFGEQDKSCLMVAKIDAEGNISDVDYLVKKNVYGSSANAGLYIDGNYIYYATPNTDKDRTGAVNDTYLDFYRTSLDRTKTECIYTIANRSADYFVAGGALYILDSSTLYKVDLNKKNTKQIKDKDNYVSVMENVSSLKHIVAGGAFNGATLVLSSADDETSWQNYNTLTFVDAKGNFKTLITNGTYAVDDVNNLKTNNKIDVKDYKLIDNKLTLYYTKTDSNSNVTLNAYTLDSDVAFDKANEVLLMNNASSVTVKGVDATSAFITVSSAPYLKKVTVGAEPSELGNVSLARAITLYYATADYVYYMDSSSGTALYRFKVDGTTIEEKIADMTVSSSWHGAEVLGGYIYYLDSGNNYLYRAKLATAEITVAEEKDMVVGKMTADDYTSNFESDED